MLRRQARLRREFLKTKYSEIKNNKSLGKKKDSNYISTNGNIASINGHAAEIQKAIHWKTVQPTNINEIDNEYRYAACQDPKIVITTSHNPSAGLKMFTKELRLIFPFAQKINRGNFEMKKLIKTCRANDVTDFIVVHEHRGIPKTLIVCHFPFGPTAFFNISDVVMRHDIQNVENVSEQKPHLIFHNFESNLALRTKNILKHLFPVPKEASKRVITFANNNDSITFRHHTFQNTKDIELIECGPRFQLKLFKIIDGTLDELNSVNTEFTLRPFLNNNFKKHSFTIIDNNISNSNLKNK